MASRDLHSNINAVLALKHTAISANGATNGEIIDTLGFGSVEFVIQSGTLTDGTYTPSLTVGDAANLSDGIAATKLLGTIAGATFAATDDDTVKRIGYSGHRRYVRLTITAASVTSGGAMMATAVLGHPMTGPQS